MTTASPRPVPGLYIHVPFCASKCPYGLDTPRLLQDNYKEYWTHF